MSETVLIPCSSCDSDHIESMKMLGRRGSRPGFKKRCSECGLSTNLYLNVEDAITAWNRRPREDALKAKVAELEKRLRPYLDAEEQLGMDLANMLIKLHAAQMQERR